MGRTLWGEPFFFEEHFEESTIGAQSTLRRALFERRALRGEQLDERRALWGEHYLSGEHFEESTIFLLMTLFFWRGEH